MDLADIARKLGVSESNIDVFVLCGLDLICNGIYGLLKVDKIKLIELCGTSESEFSCISNSMKHLCHDVFGIAKEKKDPKEVKGNRELLDAFPEKRKFEDGGYSSDDVPEHSSYKKRKRSEKVAYEGWKSSVISSNKQGKKKGPCKRAIQTRLNFGKEAPESQKLEAL
ncbi:origin of replication complex subunit 6 [Tripterygium wilfordii]|uniref:Origin of replication complex subunit 6 n=1 Tax=Tripterygium wilfordii TaxID=458696 RepID=A0A7J7D5G0_TRIWF|nr:origin of replication complex subunit 6 [Tripterygium wilfordii]